MAPFPTPAQHSLEEVDPSSEIRTLYPKDFFPDPKTVHLPQGKTTYWILGPENGPKVALVHGIATPALLWKYVAPFLAENGFRVLVYDLYGRGYSEAPDTVYSADLYTTQLALLLQHVRWEHAHIVGISMGGGITAAFAATFPNLVTEKLVFIASVGLEQPSELPASLSEEAPALNLLQKLRTLQTACLPGYKHALLSSYTDGPIRGLENAFTAIAETPRLKCLIIHGTKDATVNIKLAQKIKDRLPAAEFVPIEGADHDLLVAADHYERVRTTVLKFLQD